MADSTQTIVDLEKRFWKALVDKNAEAAAGLIADECLITGPSGAMRIDPAKYKAMMRDGQTLTRMPWIALSEHQDVHPAILIPGQTGQIVGIR